MKRTWTLDDVRALGTQTDIVTACEIAYGVGRTAAYELHRRDELHFPALRVGNKIVVPVEPLLHFLTTGEKFDPLAAAEDLRLLRNWHEGPGARPASEG